MEERTPTRLTAAQGRRFAFTVGGAFIALSILSFYRGRSSVSAVLASIGILLALSGAIAPGNMTPVWRIWMGLGRCISSITTPIFLGLVYFAVFVPTGFIMRLANRNPLARRAGPNGYWIKRNESARRSSLERQF
jgi:hypothetical protein